MGIMMKQNDERSQLQQKLAADIAERQRARAKAEETPPDGVNDSQFVEGTAHISRTGVALLIVLVAVVSGIIIFVSLKP